MPLTPEEKAKGYGEVMNGDVVDTTTGQLVRRYTSPAPAPANPVPTTPSPTPTAAPTSYGGNPILSAPTLQGVDENAIREETRKRMQSTIDAINADYANRISQENVQGQDRAGQTRAINARSGLMGSDFGAAQQEKTTQFNKEQVKALEDEKAAKVLAVQQNIEDRASAEIQARKQEALGQYERDFDAYQKAQESARADLKALASSGVDLAGLNPAQKAALFKQAGYDEGMGEIIYNAMKPKPSQIDYKFEKLADGQGLFYGTDPVTGQLVEKRVSVPVPPGYSLTVAPDGTPLIFNKDTGEAKVADGFSQGQFAKPTDAASEFLDNPKKQAAFNQIVSKYNTSPLIQAADRTVVLKNTIDAVKQDPSNGAKQLSLAYGYIQALDTYQSAVREGELSLVNSIDSKVGKFQNTIQQIQNGQVVRPEVIKEIADTAANLVDYITEGARNKEKVFESQARVNGIEDAWNEFRSGFSASYDQQPVQLTPLDHAPLSYKNPTFDAIAKKYPYKEVEQYLLANPNATEEDIKQGIQELQGGFNKVGKTSASIGKAQPSSIALMTAKKFPVGSVGGQCTTFLHKIASFPSIGDGKYQKFASVNKYGIPAAQWRNQVRVGDIIVTGENKTYGHTAMVNAILPDGRIQLTESNFHGDQKVTYNRTLPITSPLIYGAIRPQLNANLA